VDILRKGRQELHGLRVEARGERRQEPPHRYTRARLLFHLEGPVERSKAERAVGLSFETYCSVLHTLDEDLEVGWEVRLDETVREPGAT
jgi:putative redox protein